MISFMSKTKSQMLPSKSVVNIFAHLGTANNWRKGTGDNSEFSLLYPHSSNTPPLKKHSWKSKNNHKIFCFPHLYGITMWTPARHRPQMSWVFYILQDFTDFARCLWGKLLILKLLFLFSLFDFIFFLWELFS